jgi:hypothetical protein
MDTWKFYDITHREHVVCNPTSSDLPAENLVHVGDDGWSQGWIERSDGRKNALLHTLGGGSLPYQR